MSSQIDREAKSRELIEPVEEKMRPRIPVAVMLFVLLIACIGVAIAFVASAPNPTMHQQSDEALNNSDSSETENYGEGTPTPPPVKKIDRASRRRDDVPSPTPAPGATGCDPASCPGNSGNPAQAQKDYTNAATAATTSTVSYNPPTSDQSSPTPERSDVVVTPSQQTSSSGADLEALRQRLLAESQGAGADVPGIAASSAPQTNGTPDPGVIGTQIYKPAPYVVPMGSCVHALLYFNVDSGLGGPLLAFIDQGARDPRNRAWVIPPTSIAIGHYVGLSPNAQYLATSWDYLRYPNLDRRPLTAAIATTATTGESGLPGHVNTHLFKQFRDTFIGSIVGAAGQIVASALNHGTTVNVAQGTTLTTSVPGTSPNVPTLYSKHLTEFCLYLSADYDAQTPYNGGAQ